MMLLTKANREALPGLYSQDGRGFEAVAQVKFFGGGRFTFYATEYDPEQELFFGWIVSPLGADCDEWCYMALSQLQEMRFPPFGLPVERDRYFTPAPLGDVLGRPDVRGRDLDRRPGSP